jgi:outer membrane protein insertion porin family
MKRTLLAVLLVLLFQGLAVSAAAKLVTIEPIPTPIPEDLLFGEILREVRVEGNDYTREWIIRKAIRSEIGHPYTRYNAERDVLWLIRLGAFTSVTLATEPVEDGIALIVKLTEASPYIPSLSMSLTQENGFEIGPAVSSSNLLGTASRASAYFRVGGATNAGFRYAEPLLPGRSFLYGYRLEYFHRERTNVLMSFQETTDEILFEFLQATQEKMRSGLRFRYIGLKSDGDGMTLSADNYDHIPSLGLFLQHDSRNGVYPTDGYYLDFEAGKWGIFGGDGDWWRLDLDIRSYRQLPFLGRRHSLAFSSFASLTSGEPGTTIPYWSEFYVGGTNSVRGWSLGSRQGQHQWLNTVEYWFQLMEQKRWKFWFVKWRMGLQIGGFFDFGTAWSDFQDLEGNMISGGGAGLRLTLPVITMFRMDFAYGEEGMGLRFFIGGSEKAIAQKQRVR